MNTLTAAATAAEIAAAATAYNSEYPEAAAEIAAGTATWNVTATLADGRGWELLITVAPVVVLPDGGIAFAEDPRPVRIRRHDGRATVEDIVKRNTRRLGIAGAVVPVRVVNRCR